MTSRLERIEEMLKDTPSDQFLRYSLAMELRKEGESDRCTDTFRGLISDQPPHVPAYLMFAQYLSENDRVEEAKEILETGIEEARKQNESHAAGEMNDLLMTLAD